VTLLPRSLLARTLLVVVAALVLSQAASLYLLHEHVMAPRNAFGIGQFVSHLKTIGAALQTMSPEQQQEFITRIAEKEGIRLSIARGNERMRPAPDVPPVRVFRERVRDIFGTEADVYVRERSDPADEPARRRQALWIKLPAGEREFWVAFPRGRIDRDPTAALLAWSVAGLGIAVLATFFIVWRLNRPLAELARAADRLGGGADPPPVAEAGPSEVRAVTRAFNRMQEGLQKDCRRAAATGRRSWPACRTTCARLCRASSSSWKCSRAASSRPRAPPWARTWTTWARSSTSSWTSCAARLRSRCPR
jgi:two-component system, OmpR family, osmolarity sensor histidine kinase EnvZ